MILKKIEFEKAYFNFDNDDFQSIRPNLERDFVQNDATLTSLVSRYGIDGNIFLQHHVFNQIQAEINIQANNQPVALVTTIESRNWAIDGKVDISKGVSDIDKRKICTLKRVINSYHCILKKSFKDEVPKFIVCDLIKASLSKMRSTLQANLSGIDDLITLTEEDPEVKKQRDDARNNLHRIETSLHAIKEVS